MKNSIEELSKRISKEELEEYYFERNMKVSEIMSELNISQFLFYRLLEYYNISKRTTKIMKSTKAQDNLNKLLNSIDTEQLVDDYTNKNMSYMDICKKYNLNTNQLDKIIKALNIKKSKSLSAKLGMQTRYENAGSKEAYDNEFNKKRVETNISRYGQDYKEKQTAKMLNTVCEKYGDNWHEEFAKTARNNIIKKYGSVEECYKQQVQKANQTKIEHYGSIKNCHKQAVDKSNETKIEHYGDLKTCYQQAYVKASETLINKYGDLDTYYAQRNEKSEETKIERYGSLEELYNESYKKAIKTKTEKYGSLEDYYKQASIKCSQTKRINGTFNTSKPEDEYYEYLKTLYDEDDIIRQYKDERYPFACDFYIKSLDLFIECNYSWTHGGHLFNPDCEEDQQTLAEWQEKAKTSEFYKNAIETWTIRDVKKHETAKENNLNYLVLY